MLSPSRTGRMNSASTRPSIPGNDFHGSFSCGVRLLTTCGTERSAPELKAGLDLGELAQDVGHVLEPGPVELQVLARREVGAAAVISARDVGEPSQLPRGKHPVGDGHPQHRGMPLEVEAVLQPQRPEPPTPAPASGCSGGPARR